MNKTQTTAGYVADAGSHRTDTAGKVQHLTIAAGVVVKAAPVVAA